MIMISVFKKMTRELKVDLTLAIRSTRQYSRLIRTVTCIRDSIVCDIVYNSQKEARQHRNRKSMSTYGIIRKGLEEQVTERSMPGVYES